MEGSSKKRFVSRIPSIIGIILCIFLVPILIMNVTIVVKSYITPNKVPDFFGIKPFIVLTGSMEDQIYGGDLVVTKTIDPATLKKGDIISYKDGDSVITHRIVGLNEENGQPTFITKGDANNTEDQAPVSYSQVEGKYLFKIARMGNLAMFTQKPEGMIIFVGIPLCGFILYDIIRRRLQNRKNQKKDDDAQAEIDRLKAQLAENVKDGTEIE